MDAANTRMITVLLLTIVCELLAFWLFIKSQIPKNMIGAWMVFIIGLNLLTNPLANGLYNYIAVQTNQVISWGLVELLVVTVEAIVIKVIMTVSTRRSFRYSFVLNGTSITLGAIALWHI